MRFFSATFLLAFAACQASGPTYSQDVKPILDGRCTNCHVEGGVAPFSLVTWADAKAHAAVIADAVSSGRMPPWKAAPAEVSYLRNPSLTDAQKAAIVNWAQNPVEGDAKKPGAAISAVGGGIQRVDVTLNMPEVYQPTKHPDDYRCFVLTWPGTATQFVTGVNALPGTPTQVHHIALYLVPPDAAQYPPQWDAEDATPGYDCFGGPFGDRPQQFAVNQLTAWIPGYAGTTFPRGGGIRVEPGTMIVMQVHYNLASTPNPAADQTSMQFSVADTVEREFAYQPALDVAWVAGGMNIPAGEEATFQWADDPRTFFSLLGSPLDMTNGFNIEAVMFHMHSLGRAGEVWLVKPDKRVQVLNIPSWDFHWQNEYQLAEPVRFEPGDQLRVKCTFDNTAGTSDVNWGEATADEMCVANILSSK